MLIPDSSNKHIMPSSWFPIIGEFEIGEEDIIFKGGIYQYIAPDGKPYDGSKVGNLICDKYFEGGEIGLKVEFEKASDSSTCQVIINYDPKTKSMVCAGIRRGTLNVASFDAGKWEFYGSFSGDPSMLKDNVAIDMSVRVKGTEIAILINGVVGTIVDYPFPLPRSQIGFVCQDFHNIKVTHFQYLSEKPTAFVVMAFKSPYYDIYSHVISQICTEFDLTPIIANEVNGPGMIIMDIIRDIRRSSIVIADVTPDNPNVFYEVGYAHAINKPTILIAQKGRDLPFDVNSFRTLFYEDSISGKSILEDGLRNHIKAMLGIGKLL